MTTSKIVVCNLCNLPAAINCKQCLTRNDTICFNCDTKLHMATTIMSVHRRTLLCEYCHDLTPCTASGPSLPKNISFCLSCYSTISQISTPQSEFVLPSTVLIEHGYLYIIILILS